jgi:RimJ/RimL family protein N-acetyltransferase
MHAFLTREHVALRPLELDDLLLFREWFADREAVRYSLGKLLFPQSELDVREWLERTIRDKQTLSLGIVERRGGALIGHAGIAAISAVNRSGEYYIFIGDKGSWGKGYGTEVTRVIIGYGFASLNLHRIALTVSDENIGGVKAYTRAGFTTEGVLRQAAYRDGRYHDKIVMSILRPEWDQLQGVGPAERR